MSFHQLQWIAELDSSCPVWCIEMQSNDRPSSAGPACCSNMLACAQTCKNTFSLVARSAAATATCATANRGTHAAQHIRHLGAQNCCGPTYAAATKSR